ncbi:Macrolide transporter ATP-binding /permease protein [Candidatus Sulfotelmatobacter kueseliae]|uniref:Macrolide transporter ATP-binding /permease protein n=1 Tax=Candidatus Sulfotelmatobacter kueseliae TaxID=2042962 RepID=A0A2U3KQ23_9BACT|nr:Macrolide transporter ATP-binding /permease protein [Candidatus Sulfotelmatobacter kueseliae]
MNGLIQDVRYALRQLRKSPGFTAAVLLILALGIGANSAIFSVVNALLLNPYPFPQADRLAWVDARHLSGRNSSTGYRDFLDWREQNTVFSDMAIVPSTRMFTWSGQGEAQRIAGGPTTANFLRVLGLQPALGRFFNAEKDKPSAAGVVVLSFEAWQHRFSGNADVLGRVMMLNGEPYTIIGVMPKRFVFPGIQTCEFFTALQEDPANGRYQHQYGVVARLKPGVTLEQAQANMTVIARRLEQEYPVTNTGWGVAVLPLRAMIAGDATRPTAVLFGAVFAVLLLACANVAGLMLARAASRTKEIAVRAALGAARARLVRQMLTESLLLALAACGFGLVFAEWLMNILRSAAPEELGLDTVLRMDSRVLLFTVAISAVTGLVFGLVPAWYGARTDVNTAIKDSAGSSRGVRSRRHVLSYLVVSEVALSSVLLVGAGFLTKDLFVLLHLDLGIRTEHVLTFGISLPYTQYSTVERVSAFYEALLERLRAAPGVQDAAAVDTLPMTGGYSGGGIEIQGRPKPADWMEMETQFNSSSPGYFRIMGISMLRGRDFDEHDTAKTQPVAIINDAFARRFFPDEDPIGRGFRYSGAAAWITIVGVTGSFKHQQPMQSPVPMVYTPCSQEPGRRMWVAVRASGDPTALAATVRSTVQALDRDLPVLTLRAMRQVVSDSLSQQRLIASFLAGFAVFALVLAAIGIYSIIAFSAAQRMQEMGLRLALGASRADVLRLILRGGTLLVIQGVAAGVPLALVLSRTIGSLLYGISPHDLTIFTGVPVVLLFAALLASYLPARRAAKVDPMVALRYE